ncbi:MAG: LPS-assembly protein LptD [Caldimicrobium sp.]
MKYLLALIVGIFLFINVKGLSAYPVTRTLEFTANKVEVLYNGKKILAEGDVILEKENLLLYAERALYDPQKELLEIENFKLFDFTQNATILGEKAQLDIRNGEIYSPKVFLYFKKEGFRIKAWDFSKNALNEYLAKRALITTCDLDCEKEKEFPPWSFEVRDMVIILEGKESAQSTLFRLKKTPVLYLPKKFYLPSFHLPILEPRKAGFLPPSVTQGNRLGFGIQLPYFYPLTDQIDFTLAPLYTTKRGLILDFESAIGFTNETKGLLKARYLRDTKKREYLTEKTRKDRYWVTGKFDYSKGENWDAHLDLDFISERDFLEEFNVGEGSFDRTKSLYLERFSRDIEDKTQDYRSTRFWLQYSRQSFYGLFSSKYIDYVGAQDKKEILQPLVGLYLSLLPFEFNGILPALNLTYDYFYRERNYYGSRAGLSLELSYPFSFSFLKSEFKVNSKNYLYFLENKGNFSKDSLHTNLLEASYDVYTQLYRNYSLNLPFGLNSFTHILKPYVKFFYRKEASASEIPLFVYEDYFTDKIKALEYGLWQFFSSPQQKNFLVIKAYQQYDFTKVNRSATGTKQEERALSDLYLQILSNWKGRFSMRYDTTYNFYGYGIKKHSFNLSLRDFALERVDFTYQEDKVWKTRQATLRIGEFLFNNRLAIDYYISRNLITDETSEQKLEALYLRDCYLFGLGVSITPRDTKFYFRVDLKGLGGFGTKGESPLYFPKAQ